LLEKPRLGGEITLGELNPKELMRRLGKEIPSTRDEDVLTSFRMQMGFEKGPDSVQVKDFTARLDDTSLNGSIKLENLDDPAIDLAMHLDTLNADRYLPPAGHDKKQLETSQSPAEEKSPIPSETIREQDIDGRIEIGELTLQGMHLQNLGITLAVHDGVARINPLKADLYQGSLHTLATLDVGGETPRMQVDHKMNRVEMQPLLEDVAGVDYLKGRAEVKAELFTRGAKSGDWLQNSNGKFSLSMKDGSIRGLNLVQGLYNKIRLIQGKDPRVGKENVTGFSSLRFQGRIRDGTVRESSLSLVSPLLELGGSGKIDLVNRNFEYSLRARLTQEFVRKTGTELEQVSSTDIPISLKGPLANPGYNIDIREAIKDMGREKIKDQIQKRFLDKLEGGSDKKDGQDSVESKARELLDGLF